MTVNDTKHWDKVLKLSNAPGYRDVSITIRDHVGRECEINLSAGDALALWRDIGQTLKVAWNNDDGPIDKEKGEVRPRDLPR